jgi:hypothetical protein
MKTMKKTEIVSADDAPSTYNPYDVYSTYNPYGEYGGVYSSDSVNNPYRTGAEENYLLGGRNDEVVATPRKAFWCCCWC